MAVDETKIKTDHNALLAFDKFRAKMVLLDLLRGRIEMNELNRQEKRKNQKGLEIGRWQLIIFKVLEMK